MNGVRRRRSRIRVVSPKERRLLAVFSRFNETCSVMNLPKPLPEIAIIIYRNLESGSEVKGKPIIAMAAARAIWLAKDVQ
jgi:transcription initiation factor TFIIIB Brf1 subunit/transcription initiation factor TFIIB